MPQILQDLRTREDGATTVEYAVMLALVLLIALAAIYTLGVNTKSSWSSSNTQLQSAGLGGS